ncbi:MAG: glycosyltransferase family 2 protein [bacterium]|nr:glycosyltransferase family 2 protein [bacterium]
MKKITAQRLLEIFPGLLTWSTFILPVILSFIWPMVVSVFILFYAIYWLLKTFILSVHLIIGYTRFKKDVKIDWAKKCEADFPDVWQNYFHMAVIATYKEELPTLQETFNALAKSNYPKDRIIVVLGTEERDLEKAARIIKQLQEEFGNTFYKFYATVHPKDIPGETKGKGSNITYAIRQAKNDIVDKNKIPYEKIIVTSLDSDHRVDKQYFACVTHTYLSTPDPVHKSFQPIPLFFNNIWQTSFPMRLIALGSSFWQLVEATRPYRLRNFASHAQSFQGLVETDFWSVTSIVEDGHQYWRSFFKFKGNYSVVPIFTPIYQDAVLGENYKQTIAEQYLQKRRWAYGCSDIPFAIQAAWKDHEIPFFSKWVQILRLIEGHYSWATASLVLATVGWMPIILNYEYRSTVLAYNFPYYLRYVLYAAMLGMIISLTISTLLVPRPHHNRRLSYLRLISEWLLTPIIMPLTNIIFGSLPAIDSQTRIMIGKYLGEFRVTYKKPLEYKNE